MKQWNHIMLPTSYEQYTRSRYVDTIKIIIAGGITRRHEVDIIIY